MKILFSLTFLAFLLICDSRYPTLEDNELSQEIEKAFWLTVLGMKEVPVNITKPKVEKRSAPAYLMNIYSNTVSKLSLSYANYNLTYDDYHKANQSDTMVSFIAHHKTVQHTVRRMWFDVFTDNTHMDIKETLTSSDLRLYRDKSLTLDRFQGLPFNITVYRYNKGNLRYINSQVVKADHEGWIVINITDCIQWWIDNPQENEGLRLVTTPINKNRPVRHIQAEDIGISGFNKEPEKFPFVVGYYQTSYNSSNFLAQLRNKRSISSQLNALELQVVEDRKSVCQRRGMYVDFDKIGYTEWIIAPDGVEAEDCIGRCEFPFGANIDVLVHGFIKAFAQLHQVSCLLRVRCRPVAYSAGSTLYWSAEDKVTYKVVEEISASACGCR